MFYRNKRVFVTGGAGFIGHHLVDELIRRGAVVTVGDDLSVGDIRNIHRVWKRHGLSYRKQTTGYTAGHGHRFVLVDFHDFISTRRVLKEHDIVFHLAARFGGRGYINTHPANCSENFAINQNVIRAAHEAGVDRIQFASSACVYPQDLQAEYGSTYRLKESDAIKNNWANADREYGWAKLMGEMILHAHHEQFGLKGSVTRYVTAYGPWENDTHAIIMLIRRAVERRDPYVVWGTGKQDRDFTYVDDIVSGTLAACEHITDGSAVNLGTGVRYTLRDVVAMIFEITGWRPKKIRYDTTKPEGVKTRALDISAAYRRMHWKPTHDLRQGLEKTIAWFRTEKPAGVETIS